MSDPRTDRPAGRQVPAKLTDEGSLVLRPAAASSLPLEGSAVLNDSPVACQIRGPTRRETGAPISRRRQPPPTHCGAKHRNGRDLIIAKNDQRTSPYPLTASAAAAQGLFRAPARALSLSPTAPFLPTAEEMEERTPAETAFLHFLSALRLFAAVRFPSRNRRFLIVVVPPTVPAQLSAAAACYYGKNCSFCRVAG